MSITYKEYNEQYRLPEQEQAEKLLMKHKHFVLGWEPGKSKSYPVIHCIIEVQKLKQRPIKVLIMSDATCIKDMWKAEIGPQGILPRETYFVTDRTAIGNVKPALVATNWDVIVVDECFHPDTEILTEYGWKHFYELTDEKVAQYNSDGTIDFVKPIRYISKDYTGELHCIKSNNKTFKVTPNHNMVYENKVEIASNHNYNDNLIVSGLVKGQMDELTLLDRLAIACQADGCCHPATKDGMQQWDFKFTKQRKKDRLEWLLKSLNIKWTSGKYLNNYYIKIPTSLNITKDLTTYFKTLDNKSWTWCTDFINEAAEWDGHIRDTHFYYSSKNINNVKLIESILTLSGNKFNTSIIVDNRWSKTSTSYRVQSSSMIVDYKATRLWTTEPYSGKVYCVEVPSHMIIVRSPDGSAIICGNCQSLRSGVTRAKSKFAKLVYALTKRTEYVFGMTGTISGNNNIEPWCILHNLNVAGMGEINCHLFKDRYCVQELGYGPFGNFMRPTKLNESGEALMNKAYESGVMFWGYDDDDDMPPMNVEMKTFTVEATETYKDALDGILKCGEYESTMQKALAIQKAQQALNGFIYYDVEGVRHIYTVGDYVNPKLKYIGDESEKKSIIIAYRFQEDGESIKYELDKRNIKHCSDITEFKKHLQNNEHYILVLQCSRGKAVNLQECQDIIYYSSDFSFISYKQLIHRCWRRGQTNPCNVTFLINDPGDKHKVEEKIWKSLRTKQSIHDTLMAIRRTD